MRTELRDLLNKRVKCEGDIVSVTTEEVAFSKRYPKGICGRVVIRNIEVEGERISHINVRIPLRSLNKFEDKVGKHVKFTGQVYKYMKNSRGYKGRLTGIYKEDYSIKEIKKVSVLGNIKDEGDTMG